MSILSKHDVVLELLGDGIVSVHLKPCADGVVLPEFLRVKANSVMLDFGYELPKPIPDLTVNDESISGTLSFAGRPFHCVIPWDAVFGVELRPLVVLMWDIEPAPNETPTLRPTPTPRLRRIK